MQVKVKANAKINLMLDILSTLENGYHELFMIMQSVDLHDEVTVTKTNSGKIEITCSEKAIPTNEKNIAYKAAESFFKGTNLENTGIKIHLEKKIPHEAGLAGGSADGAAVVKALDKLFSAELSERKVIEICSSFGSDVPFCAIGGTMLAIYDGTIISHLPNLKLEHIIIVKPTQAVSTASAYKAFDTSDRVRHLDKQGMLKAVINGDTKNIFALCDNVFEQFIDVTDRVPIKTIMKNHGAKCSCMSGSGPSVFGIFEDAKNAKSCYEELKKSFPNTFLCSSAENGCNFIET